jgi:hypothetical protein
MSRDGFGYSDPAFEVMTESMGPLKFRRVSKMYATKIEKADFQNDLPPEAFLSLLIVILGVKADGTPISVEESYSLSHAEREAFAETFIQQHQELWREKFIQETVNEQGEKVIHTAFGDTIINPRQPGEEVIPYVTRLYRDFNKGIISVEARRMEPQRKMIEERGASLSQEEKELLLKNASLSESLGKTLAQMRALDGGVQSNPMPGTVPPPPVSASPPQQTPSVAVPPAPAPHAPVHSQIGMPHLPPAPQMPNPQPYGPLAAAQSNQMPMSQQPAAQTQLEPVVAPSRALTPLSEASERMQEVLSRIDTVEPLAVETLGMLKSLNDASVQILTDFTKTAERNRRSVRRATFLAVLAMLVAVLVPAWPYILEFYQSRQPGYQSPQAARAAAQAAAEAREAQTATAQKQQMDTLKSAVEELRAQRTAAPRPVAD